MNKFRVWDKIRKTMNPVSHIGFLTNGDLISVAYYDTRNKLITLLPSQCVVMESVGVTDKNGNEYYENDLVDVEGTIYKVGKGQYMFILNGYYNPLMDIPSDYFSEYSRVGVIIGNSFENIEDEDDDDEDDLLEEFDDIYPPLRLNDIPTSPSKDEYKLLSSMLVDLRLMNFSHMSIEDYSKLLDIPLYKYKLYEEGSVDIPVKSYMYNIDRVKSIIARSRRSVR